jgi:hypothetical protein
MAHHRQRAAAGMAERSDGEIVIARLACAVAGKEKSAGATRSLRR